MHQIMGGPLETIPVHMCRFMLVPGAERFTGFLENTDIAKNMSALLGYSDEMWGCEMSPSNIGRVDHQDTADNVIYMIGSGMGQNATQYAQWYFKSAYDRLEIQKLPVTGLVTTYAANTGKPDDLSSAIALATGRKVPVNEKIYAKSILESAKHIGKKVAMITDAADENDSVSPFMTNDMDVKVFSSVNMAQDLTNTIEALGNDYIIVVINTKIDDFARKKNMSGVMQEINQFDKAVEIASAYAGENTLLVVTADHETGGNT